LLSGFAKILSAGTRLASDRFCLATKETTYGSPPHHGQGLERQASSWPRLVFSRLVQAQTAIKFSLDWKFEGPAAPFVVAIDKAISKSEGLDVTIDTAAGSLESDQPPRLVAPTTWGSATSTR